MKYVVIIIFSYLLGSIPFGLVVTRLMSKVDIRKLGSGNIGVTNVLRTAGVLPALLTLLGDVGKGMVAVFLARYFTGESAFALLAGAFATIGHNWPIFLNFKGGKGVASAAGMLLAYRPLVLLTLVLIWLIVLIISRYISLSSIVAAVSLPLIMLFFKVSLPELVLGIIIASFTIYRHKDNVKRLREGTEFKFGEKARS